MYPMYNLTVGCVRNDTEAFTTTESAATTASAEPNFAVAFGHRLGWGARNNSDAAYEFQYPTRAI